MAVEIKLTGEDYYTFVCKREKEHRNGLVVYLWFRDKSCLYIGRSGRLKDRLSGHRSKLFKDVKATDTIILIDCDSEREFIKLEHQLLFEHRPQLNKYKKGTKRKDGY